MESHGVLSFTVVYILTDALTVPMYIKWLGKCIARRGRGSKFNTSLYPEVVHMRSGRFPYTNVSHHVVMICHLNYI